MKRTLIGTVLIAFASLSLGARAALAQEMESRGPNYHTRSWALTLPCTADDCPRFVLLPNFSGQVCDTVIFLCLPGPVAVLDRETGLVWERTPDGTRRTRRQATSACHNKEIGGRKGWRLPTISELASLVDPSRSNPALPEGHPFINVKFGPGLFRQWYWSSSAFPEEETGLILPTFPLTVDTEIINMATGSVGTAHSTGNPLLTWCVRGGR
jgi:hypothetical protein